jgi:hypothetical protein
MKAAILFCQTNSNYKAMPGVDVYDELRDARTFKGGIPVVAHPPCRSWGRLRKLAKPAPGEKELAFFAVEQVRTWGGVLEHPAHSTLWPAAGLPAPGQVDEFGGFTLPIAQFWFGHRAMKMTWLYIVGIRPADLPEYPLALGDAPRVIGSPSRRPDGYRPRKGDPGWRPDVTDFEKSATPPMLAEWLVSIAELCAQSMRKAA